MSMPKLCDWEGRPAVWVPGEAWAFLRSAWIRVDPVDVGNSAFPLSEADVVRRFGEVPPLPSNAFQLCDSAASAAGE